MVNKKVVVVNPSGLHLKPAGLLCNLAIRFDSKIMLCNDKGKSNAKSVLSVLSACVKCGDEVEIECEGPYEEEALRQLVEAIESGLGEGRQL